MCLWCEANGYRNRAFEHLEPVSCILKDNPYQSAVFEHWVTGHVRNGSIGQVQSFHLLLHCESLPVVPLKDLMLRQAQSSAEPKFGTNSVDSQTPPAVGHLAYRYLHR